jgi:hypothetical protein
MIFPPEIGWIINPEAKSMPLIKKPFSLLSRRGPLLPIPSPCPYYFRW